MRVLTSGSYGGIAQYLLGLLPELFSAAGGSAYGGKIKFKLFFSERKNRVRPILRSKVEPWFKQENVRLFQFKYPNRLLFTSSRFFNYPKLDYLVQGADVFFSPHFFSAPLSPQCRSVVTFHDLSFIRHPEFFSFRKNIWHRFEMNPRAQAERADKIIAVSHSTKNDLINLFDIEPEKIRVVYSGVSPGILLDKMPGLTVRKKYNLPEKFFLFLGTLEPRKNILGILKSFDYLKSAGQIPADTALVIVGPLGWLYADIFKFYKSSPHRAFIHILGPVEEQDKPALYSLAQVFVYPSFFEGFGFPPLEAMAAGVPVVSSRVSSLPEVTGGASVLVDPYNIKEMASAMKDLLLDKSLRNFYIKKGREKVKDFSWRKTAEETLKILVSC